MPSCSLCLRLFFGKGQSTWLGRPRQKASRNQSFPVSGLWLSISVRIHFVPCLEDSASICQDGPSYKSELKPHLFHETFPGGKEPWPVLVGTMTGHWCTPGFLSPKMSVLILPSHFSAIHMSQDNASTRVLLSEGLFNLMLSNHPYEKKNPPSTICCNKLK